MKKILLVLALMTLTGCWSRGIYLEIFNNTSNKITIVDMIDKEITYTVDAGDTVEVFASYYYVYPNTETVWVYPKNIPYDAMHSSFAHEFVYVQINEDGLVYVLHPDQKPPVTEFPEQPPGYPLHPMQEYHSEDGYIYLVPLDQTFPITEIPEQPAGFPIKKAGQE